MKTIVEQIAEMTPAEKTALINVLDLTYTVGNVTQVYITGSALLDNLSALFGDWKVIDLKITLASYHERNKRFISQFLTGLAVDLTKQVDEHMETVSDIAPATVTNTVIEPERLETYNKAPFDSATPQTDHTISTTVNNGTGYAANTAATTYDTTTNTNLGGHVSKVVSDKSGTNYPISKILTEEENRRLTDYLYRYLGTYCAEYGYRLEGVF